MNNTPTNKYDEICEQVKQALTVIIIGTDIIRTRETLSQEGKKCLQQIKDQAWRIDKELKKGESQNEAKIPETLQSSNESNTRKKFIGSFQNDK